MPAGDTLHGAMKRAGEGEAKAGGAGWGWRGGEQLLILFLALI